MARVVSAATTLGVLAVVGRALGPEALGIVGIGLAFGAIGTAVSDLGMSSLLVREAARRPDAASALFGAGLALRVVLVPAVLAAVYGLGWLVQPDAALTMTLVAAGLVAQQTAELSRAGFIAAQRMTVPAAHVVVENVAWLLVVSLMLADGADLAATFIAALGVWGTSIVVGFGLAGWLLRQWPTRPTLVSARAHLRLAAPFAAFSALGLAYSRIDTILVGVLAAGPALAAAGAYYSATRLIAALEYLPEAVSRATYPELARRIVTDPASAVPIVRTALTSLVVIGGLGPPILVVAGEDMMSAIFGPNPGAEAWLLGGLALAVPIRFAGYLLGTTLTSGDAQGRRVAAAASSLVVVLVIDLVGLPIVGLVAPIAGTIAASVVVAALYARFVRAILGPAAIDARQLAVVGGATTLATAIGWLASDLLPVPLAASVGGLVYLALVLAGPGRRVLRRRSARLAGPA
jgi:O-antigen/teichoic acid export membrane protein